MSRCEVSPCLTAAPTPERWMSRRRQRSFPSLRPVGGPELREGAAERCRHTDAEPTREERVGDERTGSAHAASIGDSRAPPMRCSLVVALVALLGGCGGAASSKEEGEVSWARVPSLVRDCEAKRV